MSKEQKLIEECKKSEEFTIFIDILTVLALQYTDDIADAILDELIDKIFAYALLDTDIDANASEKTVIFFYCWIKHTIHAISKSDILINPEGQSHIKFCECVFLILVKHLRNIKQIIEVQLK